MTARGIDQILPHPSSPELFEAWIRDAREYVALAEERSGPIPRRVGFEYVWGDARGELERVGPAARIVNLETSITRSDDALLGKGIHYRMHPDNVGCLLAAGIDVCVLANNHVLDWGEAGLLETLDVLESAGIRVAGAGRNRAEAERPAVVPVDGDGRLIVLGLGHPSSGIPSAWAATATRPGISLLEDLSPATAKALGEQVRRAKRPGDLVVASIHWGSNWGYEVPARHVALAHALIESGVSLVHGHSSHHPRPIEIYRGGLILYGCGDFLSDYEGISGHEAYRGELTVMYFPSFDHETGALVSLRMVPMHTRKLRLERALAAEVRWLGATLARISRPFGTAVHASDDGALLVTP